MDYFASEKTLKKFIANIIFFLPSLLLVVGGPISSPLKDL